MESVNFCDLAHRNQRKCLASQTGVVLAVVVVVVVVVVAVVVEKGGGLRR